MDYPVGSDASEHLLRVSTQIGAAAAVIAFSDGTDGLLAAARVYDDIEAPVEHP